MPVQVVMPIDAAGGRFKYASGVRAGRWVFASGHMATDYGGGLTTGILTPEAPQFGSSHHEREARAIFQRLTAVLAAGGLSFADVVRVDQYYTTHEAVAPYHRVRQHAFGGQVSPSTSILQKGFLLPDASMNVQAIGLRRTADEKPAMVTPEGMEAPPGSAYSATLAAEGYVFVAGQMARGANGDIAPEAMLKPNHLWGGTRIINEANYIFEHRLKPALKAAGSSIANIVKAQVYLADIADTADFCRAWSSHVAKQFPVALTILPTATPGFGLRDARMEINLIAVAHHGPVKKEVISTDGYTPFPSQAEAIRAGDLLCLSGLMAVDEHGLVPAARIDPRQPHLFASAEAQVRAILERAAAICAAAGTSLDNLVRIQQFHTDIADFPATLHAWNAALPGRYLPLSAVELGGPLPVPGASILLDLWVHAPQGKG